MLLFRIVIMSILAIHCPPFYGMEKDDRVAFPELELTHIESTPNSSSQASPSSSSSREGLSVAIKTAKHLKDYVDELKILGDDQEGTLQADIDISLMVKIIMSVATKVDDNTLAYPKLKEQLKNMKKNDQEKFQKYTDCIIALAKSSDGDLSAVTRQQKKMKNLEKQPSSDFIDYKPPMLRRQRTTFKGIEHLDAKLEIFKSEIRQMTFEAHQKTIEEKQNAATRNAIIAAGGTVASALVAALATYYSKTLQCPSCPTCPQVSPIPPALPPS